MSHRNTIGRALRPWQAREEKNRSLAARSLSNGKTASCEDFAQPIEPIQHIAIPLCHLHPAWSAYLALCLSVIVFAFLVTITFATIPITSYGITLSNTGRNIYTVGTTILSGIIAAAIGEAIKELWLLDILYVAPALEHEATKPVKIVEPTDAFKADDGSSSIGKPPNRRATVALGLGTMKEKSDFWLQTISFLTVGLTTTGIVAGLSPDIYNSAKSAPQWSVAGIDSQLQESLANRPAISSRRPDTFNRTSNLDIYSWQLANGSWATLDVEASFSAQLAPKSLDLISTFDPVRGVGYILDGVPFLPGAIGTLALFNNSQNFAVNNLCNFALPATEAPTSGLYGSGQLVSSVACLPVLAKNPVQCHAYTNLTGPGSVGNGSITVQGCTTNMNSPTNDTAFGACIKDKGMATYVLGHLDQGVHQTSMLRSIMHSLQASVPEIGQSPHRNGSYIVACDVNLKEALAFQNIKLKYTGQLNGDSSQQHQDLKHYNPTGSAVQPGLMANVLTGTEQDCSAQWQSAGKDGQNSVLPDDLLLFIAAAVWMQIRDDELLQLMFDKYTMFNNPTDTPGLLPGSASFLEEIIGVALGMSLSYSYIAEGMGSPSLSEDVPDNDWLAPYVVLPAAEVTSTSLRIGPGKPWAIIYAIPSLYSTLLLAWLLKRRIAFARLRKSRSKGSKCQNTGQKHDIELALRAEEI